MYFMERWKILCELPDLAMNDVPYGCEHCGNEALMPVHGVALAQVHMGIVFDSSVYWMPTQIRCPECGSTFEKVEK